MLKWFKFLLIASRKFSRLSTVSLRRVLRKPSRLVCFINFKPIFVDCLSNEILSRKLIKWTKFWTRWRSRISIRRKMRLSLAFRSPARNASGSRTCRTRRVSAWEKISALPTTPTLSSIWDLPVQYSHVWPIQAKWFEENKNEGFFDEIYKYTFENVY